MRQRQANRRPTAAEDGISDVQEERRSVAEMCDPPTFPDHLDRPLGPKFVIARSKLRIYNEEKMSKLEIFDAGHNTRYSRI